MSANYNETTFNQICSHLEGNGYRFFSVPEKGVVSFNTCSSGFVHIHHLQYGLNVKENCFVVNCNCPFRFNLKDKEETRRVAEFILRANYGLRAGCFEIDYSDGEIRYRIWVPSYGYLKDETIERAIDIASAMFLRYGEGLADVVFKGVAPKDAVERCENPAAFAADGDSEGEGTLEIPDDLRAQFEALFRDAAASSSSEGEEAAGESESDSDSEEENGDE